MVCYAVKHNQLKSVGGIPGSRPYCVTTPAGSFIGVTMKKIDISTKKHPRTFALVSDSWYEELNKHKWHATKSRGRLSVERSVRRGSEVSKILMHVEILGKRHGYEIDHKNNNALDNQVENLRFCTHAENMMNQKVRNNSVSGYKGVYWHRQAKKWAACINYDGNAIHLGLFTCLIKAAKAYDTSAHKYFGEFARLNFP